MDFDHVQVELRCESPIELQFFVTEKMASLQAREVDEAEIDGLLDLVRVGACEKHP